MIDYVNPFEYEAANRFKPDEILAFYIEDHNYSRFVRSRRNIVLVGERGTGKTMTLRYNSLPVRVLSQEGPDLRVVCVYVPCNTPLTHKPEYQLLDNLRAAVISEHFLTISILYSLADTLSQGLGAPSDQESRSFAGEFEYLFDAKLPANASTYEAMKSFFQKELASSQRMINAKRADAFYENAMSFSGAIIPVLSALRKIEKLKDSHFALMLDDAHALNPFQVRILNSWIAYRDNSLFSLKVATTKVDRPPFLTVSGGEILELSLIHI